MTVWKGLVTLGTIILAGSAVAQGLVVPIGTPTATDTTPATTTTLPEAAYARDRSPATVDGTVTRQAYRVAGGTRTTLQLMEPLAEALAEVGYETVFACVDRSCGGFDFRFQLDLIGEPDMHVDLGDFRYLLARRDDGDPHSIAVVTSRASDAGFIHVTEVSAAAAPGEIAAAPQEAPLPALTGGATIDRLVANGRVVLEGLDFGSGAVALGPGPFDSLDALATWLTATPSARVVLVGHTDAVGSLEGNTTLSRQRAEAVAATLVSAYGVDAAQLSAAGAGYLAPSASNLSDTGRAANRRVEVVLLSVGQ